MRYNELGQELPDDTPLEIPAGMRRPLTLEEQIQAAVRGAISQSAARNDFETFDEANDFEIEDDDFDDVMTAHEFRDMQVEVPDEAKAVFEGWRKDRKPVSAPGAGGGKAREVPEVSPGDGEAGKAADGS